MKKQNVVEALKEFRENGKMQETERIRKALHTLDPEIHAAFLSRLKARLAVLETGNAVPWRLWWD